MTAVILNFIPSHATRPPNLKSVPCLNVNDAVPLVAIPSFLAFNGYVPGIHVPPVRLTIVDDFRLWQYPVNTSVSSVGSLRESHTNGGALHKKPPRTNPGR